MLGTRLPVNKYNVILVCRLYFWKKTQVFYYVSTHLIFHCSFRSYTTPQNHSLLENYFTPPHPKRFCPIMSHQLAAPLFRAILYSLSSLYLYSFNIIHPNCTPLIDYPFGALPRFPQPHQSALFSHSVLQLCPLQALLLPITLLSPLTTHRPFT